MIDTVGLSPEQIAAIEEQAAVERKLAKLRQDARERREQEERDRQAQIKADAETRRQKLADQAETEVRARYMQTGATEADWQRERGRLLALYREEVALGRRASAEDQARADMARRYKGF